MEEISMIAQRAEQRRRVNRSKLTVLAVFLYANLMCACCDIDDWWPPRFVSSPHDTWDPMRLSAS
ncbi:hypothetical protein CPB83DRAFT_858377 [Crepidotus variabilis]|uniref:Uncharacterized protein n=1 Tax=Crepidotus variabilis TaxID=179855 RepID=A0A9P6EBX4_9AGAR|nr:hypothetical protein CPB83DRAFT_858377 [Crepidotus variabilis]